MSAPELDLSVVIPVYNEEQSLGPLIDEIHTALDPTSLRYEIILVDDGSSDGSFRVLEERAKSDAKLVAIQFRRNFGQSAAMQAGLDEARGEAIALLDADLQNDPRDIPPMLERLQQGIDLVAGWRADRQDPYFSRTLPSNVANAIISRVTGVHLHDYGCTLKVMRREVAKELKLYGEMHRFIPAIANWAGVRVAEQRVHHRPRKFGRSKYGIGRTLRVLLDLTTVMFVSQYLTRPMQIFGLLGAGAVALGLAISSWLAIQKLFFAERLSERPLLLLGVLLIVVGIQLVSLGLVADLVARTYHESQGKRPYHVRARAGARG